MKKTLLMLYMLLAPFCAARAAYPQVEFRTPEGSFVMELYPDKAPRTVANFMQYVNNGFYEGTVFHRVISGFVVQGGGLTEELHSKPTQEPIPNEADNGLKNTYGAVAMAREFEPNSATTQFFVNLSDNHTLDFYKPDAAHIGYCVFGRVIRGMDIVEKIAHIPTQSTHKLQNVPVQLVAIEKASVLETPVLADGRVKPADPIQPAQLAKSSKSVKKRKKKRG